MAARAPARADTPPLPSGGRALTRKQTVLIVEDDPMLRRILAESLAAEGLAVLTAEDGEQALAIASTLDEQLGLVVTDVLLPVMDGLELAGRLARLKPALPVLFISGVTADGSTPGPLLRKPFGPSAFLEQVGRLLPSVQHH
jgi:two-component system, cell cycle sensor histidine kinase and response regulator CckA